MKVWLRALALSGVFVGGAAAGIWGVAWWEKRGAAVAVEESVPEPEPVRYRYKRPSQSPRFGQAFDFTRALTGATPEVTAMNLVRAGILVDLDTHEVLWALKPEEAQPIASLTKLLTFLVVMDRLEADGTASFDSLVTVSRDSTRANPVKINLSAGEKIPLRDLMTAVLLMSANDAAQQVAEYFGDGRMENFVAQMNAKAAAIGATASSYVNANGLPIYGAKGTQPRMNQASPLDLIRVIEHALEYPVLLDWTGSRQVTYRAGTSHARTLGNTNRLLGRVAGADGLKTGYTNAARHCLAFTAERNGRRLAGVALGFDSRDKLFDFSASLLEWGFRQPRNR